MRKRENIKMFLPVILAFFMLACESNINNEKSSLYSENKLYKLEYNNPGLLVDLDAGFKAVPMPMDFDGDGDYDLLVSESGCYAESGIFYFENYP